MESNSDSLSSGERNGKSLNRCGLIVRRRCHIGVEGLVSWRVGASRKLQSQVIVEQVWKGRPQKVIALYTKSHWASDDDPE